ncbi:glycosyltransferase family 2 protein [Geomesophilobacter sediminis]|uniref:Glycosyltransferase family 2 protein n=1 Tax=Geomesophilobacter sediminis TaxID=2798584 RepID=A0A8J7SCP4_9BACT|nr:glycosyltransferase family 2 protein [Geomesophilobacter sediminis]MBJ6727304.1 glycosyltransferase family 2 protein [Geomesophilobacter sediminis]
MRHELALVMPVYNEEECIEPVVTSWRSEFVSLGIDFVMLVLNDGSRDRTAEVLARFGDDPRIRVINKANSGHGPTILQGYRFGVELAEWVFQTDSDDEMKPQHFKELWLRRNQYDALFGFRQGREQSLGRSLISLVSRRAVGLLFGSGVVDVNTPYRLIRSSLLQEIVRGIPDDTFAPNLVISGMVARKKSRIYNHPVPHEGRRTGSVSIVRWKLWKAALRSLLQTVKISRS